MTPLQTRLVAFVYKIAMSVLIEFVEWVKAEAEKSDDLIMEDARIIGKEKISAVLEAVSYRNNRLTEADSDQTFRQYNCILFVFWTRQQTIIVLLINEQTIIDNNCFYCFLLTLGFGKNIFHNVNIP
jgi:hypothetical protein